jgi:hypothetical protein
MKLHIKAKVKIKSELVYDPVKGWVVENDPKPLTQSQLKSLDEQLNKLKNQMADNAIRDGEITEDQREAYIDKISFELRSLSDPYWYL